MNKHLNCFTTTTCVNTSLTAYIKSTFNRGTWRRNAPCIANDTRTPANWSWLATKGVLKLPCLFNRLLLRLQKCQLSPGTPIAFLDWPCWSENSRIASECLNFNSLPLKIAWRSNTKLGASYSKNSYLWITTWRSTTLRGASYSKNSGYMLSLPLYVSSWFM